MSGPDKATAWMIAVITTLSAGVFIADLALPLGVVVWAAYLILLLQQMIEAGIPMAHSDTPGHYMEVDTQEDFELARRHWNR